MFSLMDGAFQPSATYPDIITYMTSITHLQSVRAGIGGESSCVAIADKIKDLVTTKSTRLQGLQLFEIALQQSPEIYMKGRWIGAFCDMLDEPISYVIKEQICKVICLLIPLMAKHLNTTNDEQLQLSVRTLYPYLLEQIENNIEWIEYAALCLSTGLKYIPDRLVCLKPQISKVILHQLPHSVSSKTFEVLAECFALLPSCTSDLNSYSEEWTKQYLKTISSMQHLLNLFLSHFEEDMEAKVHVSADEIFSFDDQGADNLYSHYMMGVCRYINLCKCLAKMLSTGSKQKVKVPLKLTLECVMRLFHIQDLTKAPSSLETQIVLSTLSQMQIASLLVVESLILQLPNIVTYSFLVTQLLSLALQASELPNISSERIRPLRLTIWKLIIQWISKYGSTVTYEVIWQQTIIREILKDISVEDSTQATPLPSSSKSKKSSNMNSGETHFAVKSQQVSVCKEALEALECILHSGASYLPKNSLMELFLKVSRVASTFYSSGSFPFPYADAMCRKQLCSVLLAFAALSKPNQLEPLQFAVGFFRKCLQDPSTEVATFARNAMSTCRLCLHPSKPVPIVKEQIPINEQPEIVNNSTSRYSEWTPDKYVQNLPPVESVSSVSENIDPRVAQTFHNANENEMLHDKYMEVDVHYSDQAAENQCNGEDVLEIQNSSQCQDDVDSDDEDEEDEDEPSYGDDEINQDVEMQEHLYIPSTSKIQILNPVHITPETNEQNIGKEEYEELRPCKSDDSNKNMHLNGIHSNPEEKIPSAAQNIASENGIYGLEDEDLEEEEDADEDEEDDNVVFPADKKGAEYFEPPAKKQKSDETSENELQDEREGSRSPTLVEMKADFCCNEADNVKS